MRRRVGLTRSVVVTGVLLLAASMAKAKGAPLTPPSLSATAVSTSQIRLNWTDANQQESGFQIERSLSSTSGFALIYTAAKNSITYTNSGLASGTRYYYRVRATASSAVSAYSNVASAVTQSATSTGIPAAPSNLRAAAASSSLINLAWTDNSTNETAFKVERATASAGPWAQIGTTAASGYGDSGRAAGTTYYYRVRAYNAYGNSAYSNTASSVTQSGTSVPATPASLSATAASSTQINLAWADTSSNESGFKIERSTATSGWAQIATVGVNVRSFASTGLTGSTAYYYRVRAYNTSGDSGYSNTASASTSGSTTLTGGGAHLWSTDFGGPNVGGDVATPSGIVTSSTGEAIVVGYMKGTVSFGGTSFTSAGLGDIYLVKYSSAGARVWAKRFGGTGDDRPKGVAIDSGGNIFITGYFRNTVDFGGGAITAASMASSGFIAKYSSAGAHVWSKRLSTGAGVDEGTGIGVDGAGNPIVAAALYQTSDFGGGALTSAGGSDVVLVKYSSTGAHLWSRRLGGTSNELATSVAVDRTTGEAWATGYFAGSGNFGGGTFTSAGSNDVFVVKYSSTGSHVWSRRWGGSGDDRGYGISVDGAGNMAATGMFTNAVDFGAGAIANSAGADIFLVKYSASGICQWSRGFGSTISANNEIGYAVDFDSSGNVLLTGSTVSIVDFGGGATTGDGWYNAFVAKYNSGGGYLWAKRYVNGTGHSNGRAVAGDGSGNTLVAGDFEVAINLGGSLLQSPGMTDTFLAKLGP